MDLPRVVQLTHNGRKFTFTVDQRPPLAFWRVESEGRIYLAPLRVTGDEQPGVFRALADAAIREWG